LEEPPRATTKERRAGWEMAVRIEEIICTVLDKVHERRVEEVMDVSSERPEKLHKCSL
jgi:hypothetical protein